MASRNSTTISTTMSSAAESSTAAASSTTGASISSATAITSSIAESVSSAVSSSIPATPTSTTAAPTSNTDVVSTATVSESSIPPTTAVVTSVVTRTPTAPGDTNTAPIVVTVTATNTGGVVPVVTELTSTGSASSTSSSPALNTGGSGNGGSGGGGGLSTAGTTAVAVVVPVAVVALLVLGAIFLWRKRKAKKASEEQRRKEIEDYGFNPNNDPTLPGVGVASDTGTEMAEDNSGYRGWGAATGSNRKMSTTLSGGHTQGQLSDSGSNAYGSQLGAGSASPTGGNSDGHSSDPLMHQRRETMNSDIGSLGGAPVAGTVAAGVGVKRGPSNASSTYSAGNHSDVSDGPPPGGMGMSQSYEAYNPNGFGYSQHGPYGDGTYGGAQQDGNGMPIVRDVSARRNTRIQQPGNYQQGNSGIAQNF